MRKFIVSRLPGLFVFALVLGVSSALAQAGTLDSTFGNGGKVTTSFGDLVDAVAENAVLQPDGNLIVVATVGVLPELATDAFAVLRYLPNGKLDQTLGKGGVAFTAFTNFINAPAGVVLQSDGKIVVAGEVTSADGQTSEFAIARFTTTGRLDSSFGNGGQVTTNFVGVQLGGVRNPATAVLLEPDGKILVAGLASQCAKCSHDTALARYETNGQLDPTFGTGGNVRVRAIAAPDALALDADGNIFAVNHAAIVEFTPTGTLQSSVTPAAIVASSHVLFNAFQSDGRYIFSSAVAIRRRDLDIQVSRFNPTGSVDTIFSSPAFDFGREGINATDSAPAVAIQSDASPLHSRPGQ